MRKLAFVALIGLSVAACSTERQATGTATGVVAGAVVGGPVGAVVGGAIGAAATAPGTGQCYVTDRRGNVITDRAGNPRVRPC
jgi:hypothetical protein